MVFSSPVFLFIFLPIVVGVYFILPKRFWNAWLLLMSLLFYAWGERGYSLVMLVSIAINYSFGLQIERSLDTPRAKWIMGFAITANLALLVAFKYANFLANVLGGCLRLFGFSPPELPPIHLPIGISFFTFHALSYLVDIYRRQARAQPDPAKLALYITLFPQLIAGPILRFHQISPQLDEREISLDDIAAGIRRFIVGLAKKVLIANTLAAAIDPIFLLPQSQLRPLAAWLAILSYSFQLYFDFSGYSDMALGLGRMFGFRFPENFNYPYISCSIREFWRRWHISLSTWFRDYLYIPLGGNRTSPGRHYRNLILVFFLCGLWHGASWNFVLWGLFHGVFLILEGLPWGDKVRAKVPSMVGHAYAMFVVLIGWVFFRLETLPQALGFLRAMWRPLPLGDEVIVISNYFNVETQIAFVAALIGCVPWLPWFRRCLQRPPVRSGGSSLAVEAGEQFFLLALLLLAVMRLAASTYNPFIYFRF